MPTTSTSFRVRVLSKALVIGFLVAIGVVLLFAWLAEEVNEGETLRFDEHVRNIVHAHSSPALTSAMQSMHLGDKPTEISRDVGGAFTLFGGYITGRHIELVPAERIVQAWRTGGWDPGVYSIAKFELVEQGSGTRIVFDHTGFPKGAAEVLASGWKAHYWEPLAKLLA